MGEAAKRLHLRLLRRHDRRSPRKLVGEICLSPQIDGLQLIRSWHSAETHCGHICGGCFRTGLLKVNFDPALVRLLREVRFFLIYGLEALLRKGQKLSGKQRSNNLLLEKTTGLKELAIRIGLKAWTNMIHGPFFVHFVSGSSRSSDDLWHGGHLPHLDQSVGAPNGRC